MISKVDYALVRDGCLKSRDELIAEHIPVCVAIAMRMTRRRDRKILARAEALYSIVMAVENIRDGVLDKKDEPNMSNYIRHFVKMRIIDLHRDQTIKTRHKVKYDYKAVNKISVNDNDRLTVTEMMAMLDPVEQAYTELKIAGYKSYEIGEFFKENKVWASRIQSRIAQKLKRGLESTSESEAHHRQDS